MNLAILFCYSLRIVFFIFSCNSSPESKNMWDDFMVNVGATIVGGLIFTLILFLLNEYVFIKVNLTGEWNTTCKVVTTSWSKFKDLKIEYKIHLIQKGYQLSGSGEKIKDILPDGNETIFLRENRVLINIDGYVERKYFGKSIIYINVIEEGKIRKTRATYILTLHDFNNLQGSFVSTAADAEGEVKMKKNGKQV